MSLSGIDRSLHASSNLSFPTGWQKLQGCARAGIFKIHACTYCLGPVAQFHCAELKTCMLSIPRQTISLAPCVQRRAVWRGGSIYISPAPPPRLPILLLRTHPNRKTSPHRQNIETHYLITSGADTTRTHTKHAHTSSTPLNYTSAAVILHYTKLDLKV